MNFEPQKLFIGLMDFFSILLPGALLTYLLMDEAGPVVLGDRYYTLAGSEGWAAFLFASYLLGHLIFLLGSWLDGLYDCLRRYTLNEQIKRVARRGRVLPWFGRALVWLVFKRESNLAVGRATMIKQRALASLGAKDAVNTFQWCKALLNVDSPASMAVVQRFEADSKFFRCFAVVLLIVLASWPFQEKWPLTGIPIVLLLLLLALWRYMEQRYKATNQAYWSVIMLIAKDGKMVFEKPVQPPPTPTHAGGIVFRKRWWGKPKYLLVEASNHPGQWVLPKGHVEDGEQHREAAVREVHEETGVWACIVRDLADLSYSVNGTVTNVRFYLMRAVGRGIKKEKERQHEWLSFEEAVASASHNETRELIEASDMFETREMREELLRRASAGAARFRTGPRSDVNDKTSLKE
jgi:8-oxo-dGTP pyrophosphatase MutT (NUDIX family)